MCDLSHHPEVLNLVEQFLRNKEIGHRNSNRYDRGQVDTQCSDGLDYRLKGDDFHLSFENDEEYD
jgi:hypothetical protein